MEDTNSSVNSSQIVSKQSSKKMVLAFLSFTIIILLLTGYLIYKKVIHKNSNSLVQTAPVKTIIHKTISPSALPTPIVSPVTSANANQTLTNTQNSIDQSISQVNSELNALKQVNISQDTTSGF